MEPILKKHGANREFYHGGAFDGSSCRAIMGNANELLDEMVQLLDTMLDNTTHLEAVQSKLQSFKILLGLLDCIWSSVRGVDGLLPDETYIQRLQSDIAKAKILWRNPNPGTKVPSYIRRRTR